MLITAVCVLFQYNLQPLVGFYSVFIEDWLAIWPRHQFHFISFNDYTQNRTQVFEKVFRFLEVGKWTICKHIHVYSTR